MYFPSHYFKEYMKHLRDREGVSGLPNGPAFYQACLDWHLSLSMTPDQVHETGKREVARIRAEMEKVCLQFVWHNMQL